MTEAEEPEIRPIVPSRGRSPERVALFRALQLGDMLCAVPALRSLRATWPGARITLVGLPWARAFVSRFSAYLDDFLEFPGYPGIPERPPDPDLSALFLEECHSCGFDLGIQLHGDGSVSNSFLPQIQAKRNAGFYPPGGACPDPRRFLPYPESGPEVRRLLALPRFLGAPNRGDSLSFPITTEDRAEADAIMANGKLARGRFVVIHPGSRAADRRWPPEHFAEVARFLARNRYRVVVTGTAGELALTTSVAGPAEAGIVDLAGKTSLGGLAALLKRSRLVICNDTGVSHLAAAVRVPSVVVFTGSDPRRWAPLDRTLHRCLGDPFSEKPRVPEPSQVNREVAHFLSAESTERIRTRHGQLIAASAPVNWAHIRTLLLVATGNVEELRKLAPAIRALRQKLEHCRIVLLAFGSGQGGGEGNSASLAGVDEFWSARKEDGLLWSEDSATLRLGQRMREAGFDAALVFTEAGQTPYPAAYRCYLAGIPIRVAASLEFGGGLLSHWVKDLPEELDPAERYLRLLEAVGLDAAPSDPHRHEPTAREAV
jgi:ADP-heptose:LPS heptosyltransferase